MARTFKEEEYTIRRNEILDIAQKLIYTKGYEQMTIQDILSNLNISKGAFYHYFDSKQALLEALIDRMVDQSMQMILPIVEDPQLTANQKLERFFDTVARWKTAQKDFFLALLRVWYMDDNAIVRQKVTSKGLSRTAPLLGQIVRQGVMEGRFSTPYSDQIGEVLLSLLQGFADTMVQIVLGCHSGDDGLPLNDRVHHLESTVAAYTNAVERVLGAPVGSLTLFNVEVLKEWVV